MKQPTTKHIAMGMGLLIGLLPPYGSIKRPRLMRSMLGLLVGLLTFLPSTLFAEPIHTVHPATWSIAPFVILLLLIAIGPLFFLHTWEKLYPYIALGLGAIVVGYYVVGLGDVHHPIHALSEYVSFITLLLALYLASGGIHIRIDREGTPLVNCALLFCGAVLANIVGTTGASMLLIRPFVHLNRERIKPYHVVFFIFIVSNIGGSLTPIGDPPLFLGFLKGVPFEWSILHIWPMWLFAIALLLLIFYFKDRKNYGSYVDPDAKYFKGRIHLLGHKSLIWMAIIILAVFIDPNIIPLPSFLYITYDGVKISFLREVILVITGILAYKTADKRIQEGNEFHLGPIQEVAFLFIGIFATMMPALQIVAELAQQNAAVINEHSLYWTTGCLSGVLDNAPTYLNFMAAGMGKLGYSIDDKAQVADLAYGIHLHDSFRYLLAVSVSSVFFGACTYIGNAPNFMVRSIAHHLGVKMPSFGSYFFKFTIPILLPVLFLTWLVFFVLM